MENKPKLRPGSDNFKNTLYKYLRDGIYPRDLTQDQRYLLVYAYIEQYVVGPEFTENKTSIVYFADRLTEFARYRFRDSEDMDNPGQLSSDLAVTLLEDICYRTYSPIVWKIYTGLIDLYGIPAGNYIID